MQCEEYYQSFISGLVTLELLRIFDDAIIHTFSKYGSIVNHPKSHLEQRLIYTNYLSYALTGIETLLIYKAHNDVEIHGLESEFTQAIVHVLHERFYNLFRLFQPRSGNLNLLYRYTHLPTFTPI